MKQCDFKISGITRTNSATIVTVRFYEGDTKAKAERGSDKEKAITRYRRSAMLEERQIGLGGVWTDEEILGYLKKELKKDKSRSPIPEQDESL